MKQLEIPYTPGRDFYTDVEHIVTAVMLSHESGIYIPEIGRPLYEFISKKIYKNEILDNNTK